MNSVVCRGLCVRTAGRLDCDHLAMARSSFHQLLPNHIDDAAVAGYTGVLFLHHRITNHMIVRWAGADVDEGIRSAMETVLMALIRGRTNKKDDDRFVAHINSSPIKHNKFAANSSSTNGPINLKVKPTDAADPDVEMVINRQSIHSVSTDSVGQPTQSDGAQCEDLLWDVEGETDGPIWDISGLDSEDDDVIQVEATGPSRNISNGNGFKETNSKGEGSTQVNEDASSQACDIVIQEPVWGIDEPIDDEESRNNGHALAVDNEKDLPNNSSDANLTDSLDDIFNCTVSKEPTVEESLPATVDVVTASDSQSQVNGKGDSMWELNQADVTDTQPDKSKEEESLVLPVQRRRSCTAGLNFSDMDSDGIYDSPPKKRTRVSKPGERVHPCTLCNRRFVLKCHLVCHLKAHERYNAIQLSKQLEASSKMNSMMTTTPKMNSMMPTSPKMNSMMPTSPKMNSMMPTTSPKMNSMMPTSPKMNSTKDTSNIGKKKNSPVKKSPVSNGNHFQCEFCDKCFALESHLVSHAQTHASDKPYQCTCGVRVSHIEELINHEMGHAASASHKCGVCGMTFKDPKTLNRHIMLHTTKGQQHTTKAQQHKCTYCKRTFVNRQGLVVHEKAHLRMFERATSLPPQSPGFQKIAPRPFSILRPIAPAPVTIQTQPIAQTPVAHVPETPVGDNNKEMSEQEVSVQEKVSNAEEQTEDVGEGGEDSNEDVDVPDEAQHDRTSGGDIGEKASVRNEEVSRKEFVEVDQVIKDVQAEESVDDAEEQHQKPDEERIACLENKEPDDSETCEKEEKGEEDDEDDEDAVPAVVTKHNELHKCAYCRASFGSSLALSKHEDSHLNKEHKTVDLVQCHKCGRCFGFIKHLKEHMATCRTIDTTVVDASTLRKINATTALFLCPVCKKSFCSQVEFTHHQRNSHEPVETNDNS